MNILSEVMVNMNDRFSKGSIVLALYMNEAGLVVEGV